jgi:hypothetical protein
MPGSCRAPYGPLGSFLAPLRCWRIQVPSFGQPGRTDRHPEDAGGPLVITSGSGVGVGQLGEHECIAPAGLLRALGMDGFGLDEATACPRLTHILGNRVGAHDALSTFGVEPVEGTKEIVAAEVRAKAIDVAVASQSHEGSRDRLEKTPRCGHCEIRFRLIPMRG